MKVSYMSHGKVKAMLPGCFSLLKACIAASSYPRFRAVSPCPPSTSRNHCLQPPSSEQLSRASFVSSCCVLFGSHQLLQCLLIKDVRFEKRSSIPKSQSALRNVLVSMEDFHSSMSWYVGILLQLPTRMSHVRPIAANQSSRPQPSW